MKPTKITWIGFLVTLSTLSIPNKTTAYETNSLLEQKSQGIESRLSRIAKTLKQKENQIKELSDRESTNELQLPQDIAAGWLKSNRGGFLKRGWPNGWRDGGGFLKRRWPNGGWLNRGWPNGGWLNLR